MPILTLEKNTWHLTNFNDGERAFSFDPDRPADELRALLLRVMANVFANSIEVRLPKDDVLFRYLSLPTAAASRLRPVVRLQLDRLSPFRGDDVCFDYQPVAAANEGEIKIEVAIAPKSILHKYEQKVRAIGFVPRLFTIAESPLTFSPEGLPWTRHRQSQALLAMCGAIIWLSVFWVAPVSRDREIASLNQQIASLSPQARAAEATRLELDRYQLPPMAISTNRQQALEILSALTKLLPQNVHLAGLSLQDEIVTLRGTGPSSVDIKTLLTKSKLFGRISFSKMPGTSGQDQFESAMPLCTVHAKRGCGHAL